MGEQKSKKVSSEEVLQDAEKQLEKLNKAKAETSKKTAENKGEKPTVKAKKTAKKTTKKKIRSKQYVKTAELVDKNKYYSVNDAIELVKKSAYAKFDGSIELVARLAKKKNQQPLRKMIELPHGNGKKLNIAVLDETKIAEILKTKKINFDIALATPEMMPKIARIAKILGPKGKMPNPKSGTVTTDPEKTIKELSGGKVELREAQAGMVQMIVGKVSWESKKLAENIEKIMVNLPKSQLKKIYLAPTMGPSVKIKL